MPTLQSGITALPLGYWLCMLFLLGGGVYGISRLAQPWSPPLIAVLGMVAGWYLVEPVYLSHYLEDFPPRDISTAFGCVLTFVIALFVTAPLAVSACRPGKRPADKPIFFIRPELLVRYAVILWLCLLAIGVLRMDGDIFGALFPIEARSGVNMWSRAAAQDAGATGFLVSIASYLYILTLASFGILVFMTQAWKVRLLLIFCIALSWPFAFMQGSRNIALFVSMPGLFAYLLYGRGSIVQKAIASIAVFFAVDVAMRAIVELRNVGFENIASVDFGETHHLGLNMASELTYIVGFIEEGILNPTYGLGYLYELLNVVPRAIWPEKPMLGIDYSLARGYGGAEVGTDIGIFATISSGIVGQGVLNFGILLGPVAAASLAALWIGFLTRLRIQGGTSRNALFLVGLGLTFNLGRDMSLLVLFPFVFGFIGVVLLEAYFKRHGGMRTMSRQSHRLETRPSGDRKTIDL